MKFCSACNSLKCKYSCLVKKHRGTYSKKNCSRRARRKRNKLRYYSNLKASRVQRTTSEGDDLSSAITVVDIADMEWTPMLTSTTTEVAEWHKQEQVAYWKSRALSSEYENRMLLQHLRNVYAKQTEDYANYVAGQQSQPQIEDGDTKSQPINVVEPAGKKRREEMEKLYGRKASKIMGMETAVQLNYDLHLENAGKIPYWPHTPLNLKFD